MYENTLSDLAYGFGIALDPHNLVWALVGILLGNFVGVLPGLGPITAIALLLPLTFMIHAIPAIMMISGIFYGAIYGGAIGAILLNLPVHPAHAVTCQDGYPLTQQGNGGVALGVAMMGGFVASLIGIVLMILFSPVLVKIAFHFGATELFSIMLLGLVAGSTTGSTSPLKGVAMTLVGILFGVVGTDVNTGTMRFTFGFVELQDGVSLVALAMGLFGVGEFLLNINRKSAIVVGKSMRVRDMFPRLKDLKRSVLPILRGTTIGVLFGAMPGTGPTTTTFIAYALEKKMSKNPERFGRGAIEGVAAPEASTHAKTQIDFVPTLLLGIPGDPVMALILGAFIIQGINPGPQLIVEHRDLFWGLIGSFWIGNMMLFLLNVPLIGIWVKLLQIPYRYLVPSALFFIAVGVFSDQNTLFEVAEALALGLVGWLLLSLEFPLTPILLGYVLGPMVEENFRRALIISNGNLITFIERPISAAFLAITAALVFAQIAASLLHSARHRQATHSAIRPWKGSAASVRERSSRNV